MRKWHHACASWNGKTGEWQLWVKAERVGRGFHNRVSVFFFFLNYLLLTIAGAIFNKRNSVNKSFQLNLIGSICSWVRATDVLFF